MLINETITTAVELGLVRQHLAQALHQLELPPEAVARPFEAHVHVAHAALQDPSQQPEEALEQADTGAPLDLDVVA
eukprot:15495532-Heterocapsa_arctica.AAC.1